jgi:cell division protein FtsW
MMQPDLGTGTVLVGTGIALIFAAGARLKHIFGFMMLGVAGFVGLVLAAPYRIQRITAFLNPWQDPLGAGYQLIQSLFAIGPGGLLGLGLGLSRQKHLYLPEPHTDFIFSILAEELGFLGAGSVIILFAVLVWRGVRIAIGAPDLFSGLMATGITAMIMIQSVINIGVVSGAFPVTGITLPFLSYGGSSLTLTLVAVGILLNLSRYTRR